MTVQRKYKKAVALQYNQDEQHAPQVIARGAGEIAKNIIAVGEENKVPVMNDENLLALLYPLKNGEFIPESLYLPVAKLLAYLALYKKQTPERKFGGESFLS